MRNSDTATAVQRLTPETICSIDPTWIHSRAEAQLCSDNNHDADLQTRSIQQEPQYILWGVIPS